MLKFCVTPTTSWKFQTLYYVYLHIMSCCFCFFFFMHRTSTILHICTERLFWSCPFYQIGKLQRSLLLQLQRASRFFVNMDKRPLSSIANSSLSTDRISRLACFWLGTRDQKSKLPVRGTKSKISIR